MKVFVCCLFVTITIENWNKFHQILLLLSPLQQTNIWQTKDGKKVHKIIQNVVSLSSGIRQNHISDDICKNGLKHLWFGGRFADLLSHTWTEVQCDPSS